MPYTSVEKIRADGVDEDEHSDPVVENSIAFSSEYIDRVCNQFFELREDIRYFDGNGYDQLDLDVPLMALTKMEWQEFGNAWQNGSLNDFRVYNRIPQDQSYPRIKIFDSSSRSLQFRSLGVFPKGTLNVRVTGQWGFVEPDGAGGFKTPLMIERSCRIMAIVWLASISDGSLLDVLQKYGLTKERTKHHAIEIAENMAAGNLTGLPMVDNMLRRFKRTGKVTSG